MSFQLAPDERLGDGVLRAAAEEVQHARAALRRKGGSDDDPAHEARKRIKRARALLRLGEGFFSDKLRRRQNAGLRSAARSLGVVRDRRVLASVVARIANDGPTPDQHLLTIADKLSRELPTRGEEEKAFRSAFKQLGEVEDVLTETRSRGDGAPSVGLRRAYAAGRRAMRAAARGGGAPCFHEWRKRAKDLRYQLEFLAPIWPGILPALADDLHRLTDLLGEANDIELLAGVLEATPNAAQEELSGRPASEMLSAWQSEKWCASLRAGAPLYAEKPAKLVARMEAYWHVSRMP